MIPNIQPVSRASVCSLCDAKVKAGGAAGVSLHGFPSRTLHDASRPKHVVICPSCPSCTREIALVNGFLSPNGAAQNLLQRLPVERVIGEIRDLCQETSTWEDNRYDLHTQEDLRNARCAGLEFAIGLLESILRDADDEAAFAAGAGNPMIFELSDPVLGECAICKAEGTPCVDFGPRDEFLVCVLCLERAKTLCIERFIHHGDCKKAQIPGFLASVAPVTPNTSKNLAFVTRPVGLDTERCFSHGDLRCPICLLQWAVFNERSDVCAMLRVGGETQGSVGSMMTLASRNYAWREYFEAESKRELDERSSEVVERGGVYCNEHSCDLRECVNVHGAWVWHADQEKK